ncbi:MAG TPA: carnitine dehydratase [Deltaproteobacteria bacterium]|jgi:alpha-methylacyl-CoA racemase|nr:carnitine dehydratase [Deltaproteobacteria bacterium]
MASPAALDGIMVLDFSTVGPAARCARILADYGATVVKIGAPKRAGAVQTEAPFHAYAGGRGMKQVRIDLKSEAGRAAVLRLAAGADVVIESFRPGVAARLGIGHEELRAVNERIVYCSTSGYGQEGARASWAGHDLDYLAVGGFLHMSGRRNDGGPALPGATIADAAAGGMQAAIAIFAALLRRSATGEGAYIDVSVADGVLSLLALTIDQHLATGTQPAPGGDLLSGRYACYDVYPAGDGKWLAVAAIEPAFWANLCRALGLERWVSSQLDDAAQEKIRADLRAAFAARSRDEWIELLAPRDTCVAPVLSIGEVAADPHFAQRGAFGWAEHPQYGRFRQVAAVLAGAARAHHTVSLRGASETDTAELLRSAGLSAEEIAKLESEGIIA